MDGSSVNYSGSTGMFSRSRSHESNAPLPVRCLCCSFQRLATGNGIGFKEGLLSQGHNAITLPFPQIVTAKDCHLSFHWTRRGADLLGGCVEHGAAVAETAVSVFLAQYMDEVMVTYLSQIARSFLFHLKRTWRSWFSAISWRTVPFQTGACQPCPTIGSSGDFRPKNHSQ